jgi:hypothetical protein
MVNHRFWTWFNVASLTIVGTLIATIIAMARGAPLLIAVPFALALAIATFAVRAYLSEGGIGRKRDDDD